MAQSVERRIGSAEVTGSIPVTSFLFLLKNSGNSVKNHKKSQKITATINILCYTTLV